MQEIPGIHRDRVTAFFATHVADSPHPLAFELIAGGRSNLTYLVTQGERQWVLRRPPLGHVLPTAHDMTREYRVLRALADTEVPVPRPLALCEDNSINDAPFYVMEYRPGVVLSGEDLPVDFGATAIERRRISLALVDTLVQLHNVDYHEVGLDGFGFPDGYLERQVRRWAQQWERSQTAPLPEIDELIRRLRQALPTSPTPTIVHGDYRLGNVAFDRDDPGRIIAIYDWEMATLGDPLADLGYALIYWVDPEDPATHNSVGTASLFTAEPGFLRREDLIARYAKTSGRSVEHIDFYQVLALYKLAIIAEGIYARHLQGKTLGEGFAGMTRSAESLARRALAIADTAEDPRLSR